MRGRLATPSLAARAQLNQFYNGRSAGLGQAVLRLGLLSQLTPWLQAGTNFVASSERQPSGGFVADHRAEFEASLSCSVGAFTVLYRNRYELRVRDTVFIPRTKNILQNFRTESCTG